MKLIYFQVSMKVTKIREENFTFSHPLYRSHTKLAVRRSDHSLKSIFDFFTVYNWVSWVLLAFIFIAFTGFGVFVRYLEWRLGMRDTWNPAKLMFKMVRLQLIQPDSIDYKFLAGSASLITFTLFELVVIVGIYQSWVLSSVIKSKDPFPFRPEELYSVLKSKKYSIVTASKHEWIFNEIETSYATPFYELREALKDNPVIVKKDADEALQMANEGKAIIIMPNDQMITFLADKYCDLVYMDSPIPPNNERLMFRKHSPFIEPFNKAIRENQVFIQKLYRKYYQFQAPKWVCNH
ncbi:hypothetical protein M3Y97_00328800 [Aphelenchoides bicaudatus]|nr:hypothetical protein M3Y97_00328800 [Aphelenchoides bicaudatus]